MCAIDYVPRTLTHHQRTALQALSRAVIAELELRKRLNELACVVNERDIAHAELRLANENLEARVVERTSQLVTINRELETEVAARREAESRVLDLATRDALTQLPNRRLLLDLLNQQLAHAKREDVKVAVLFLDLDGLKAVNDTLGHHAGDALLRDAAARLTGCVREGDAIGRLGGDEFLISIYGLDEDRDAMLVAIKILRELASPWQFEGKTLRITASIGVAIFPSDANETAALIQCADAAMYRAKKNGKNRFRFYAR